MAHGDLAVLLPPSSAQLLIHAGVGGLMLPSHSLTHAAAVPGIANNESMCLRCCCFYRPGPGLLTPCAFSMQAHNVASPFRYADGRATTHKAEAAAGSSDAAPALPMDNSRASAPGVISSNGPPAAPSYKEGSCAFSHTIYQVNLVKTSQYAQTRHEDKAMAQTISAVQVTTSASLR